jgi:hypothetical protein
MISHVFCTRLPSNETTVNVDNCVRLAISFTLCKVCSLYWLGYGLEDRAWFPAGVTDYCLSCRVQTGSGAHPASYPVGTGCSFPGYKADGVLSWPLTSIYCRGQEGAEQYFNSPYVFMMWCLIITSDKVWSSSTNNNSYFTIFAVGL